MVRNKYYRHGGVSLVTDEMGEVTAHLHVTNSAPEQATHRVSLPGKENKAVSAMAAYLRLPPRTDKLGAVRYLLSRTDGLFGNQTVRRYLQSVLLRNGMDDDKKVKPSRRRFTKPTSYRRVSLANQRVAV